MFKQLWTLTKETSGLIKDASVVGYQKTDIKVTQYAEQATNKVRQARAKVQAVKV